MFTIEEAKQWASDNESDLDESRLSSDDEGVRMLHRASPKLSKALWDSGSWLEMKLREHGATDEQVSSICMASGQRSFGGDAWVAAVGYANEFAANGDTEEKGGLELAEKRHKEVFG